LFLQRVVGAIGGRAGAVWLQNGTRQVQLMAAPQLAATGFRFVANKGDFLARQHILIFKKK
ncbi:MAG: hypothetical protein MK133_15320, partial [Planctomycetes bacterium]|nr:hypothetical protein [Planctomycetota bacterium]